MIKLNKNTGKAMNEHAWKIAIRLFEARTFHDQFQGSDVG